MGCFTMNLDGKEEGIQLRVVQKVSVFLDYEDLQVVNFAVRLLMFLTIDLEGKTQAIQFRDELLVRQLVQVFHKSPAIKQNCVEVLLNLSESQIGFRMVYRHMSPMPRELLTIFDARIVIPLEQIIRPLSRPCLLSSNAEVQTVIQYMTPLLLLLEEKKNDEEKYDETLGFIIENTNNFVSTLLPLLLINSDDQFQNHVFELLINLVIRDEKNKLFLQKTYDLLRDEENPFLGTKLELEIKQFPDLWKILN